MNLPGQNKIAVPLLYFLGSIFLFPVNRAFQVLVGSLARESALVPPPLVRFRAQAFAFRPVPPAKVVNLPKHAKIMSLRVTKSC